MWHFWAQNGKFTYCSRWDKWTHLGPKMQKLSKPVCYGKCLKGSQFLISRTLILNKEPLCGRFLNTKLTCFLFAVMLLCF